MRWAESFLYDAFIEEHFATGSCFLGNRGRVPSGTVCGVSS